MAEYTLGQDGAEKVERARLALLEKLYDPETVRQLDAIGVGAGWRCLDVGAGSVTRLLAARVGDTGSVVSLDLDVRLLEQFASDRVEVRRHDLMTDPLPAAAFDLVHARNLLMHIPARLEALGLTDLYVDVCTHLVRGGSVGARLFADSLSRFEDRMLALGAREDDLAEAQRLLRDPGIRFREPTVTVAWGRRPN